MGGCLTSGHGNSAGRLRGRKISFEDIKVTLMQKIGEGAYGDIWKCENVRTKQKVALKQIKLQDKRLEEMFSKQEKCLRELKHIEGVVKYISSIKLKAEKDEGYERGLLLTEFHPLSLFQLLKTHFFTPSHILSILEQIIGTLKLIHETNYLHLDLKPENILCDEAGFHLKVCDFGSSIKLPIKPFSEMEKRQKNELKQYFQHNSTFMYRAPEMINFSPEQALCQKIDIWMLGCLIYLLYFRKHPFQDCGQLAIITADINYNVFVENQPTFSEFQMKCKQTLLEMMRKMLVVDVSSRISVDNLLEIVKQENSKIKKMMDKK